MTSLELKKLNAYPEFRTAAGIADVIAFINSRTAGLPLVFPPGLNARQRKRFSAKFDNDDFEIIANNIHYKPIPTDGSPPRINLEVVSPPNDATRNARMTAIFNNREKGLGIGLNQFYSQVAQKYLGITKQESSVFLKKQGNYQVTRPISKNLNFPILAKVPNECWQIDCIELPNYAIVGKNNNGHHRFILTVVDVFSGKVWAKP